MAGLKKTGREGLQLAAVLGIASLVFLLFYGVLALCLRADLIKADSNLSMLLWITQGMFIILFLAGAVVSGICVLSYLKSVEDNTVSAVNDLRRLLSGQTQTEAILTQMNENLLLSDTIKTIAFREKDRMVLEEAIQQDIRTERWDSAERLIGELAKRFGCLPEAESLKQEMIRYRNSNKQEKIDATIKHIESLWLIHRYDEAEQEVQGLLRLYSSESRVQQLRGQTDMRRQAYKKELLDQWDQAANENNVDRGVELLKLLDGYLTPTEAAALEESARGVFRAKLHNMGVQFSLFVTEKKWSKALEIGQKIIAEYPNSRMAQEVRDKIDVLQQRAQEELAQKEIVG
jgi:hypothetical protein